MEEKGKWERVVTGAGKDIQGRRGFQTYLADVPQTFLVNLVGSHRIFIRNGWIALLFVESTPGEFRDSFDLEQLVIFLYMRHHQQLRQFDDRMNGRGLERWGPGCICYTHVALVYIS